MAISLDEVRHVAKLARLELNEAEVMSLQTELNALLGHFGDLQGSSTDGISQTSSIGALSNVWAVDVIHSSLRRSQALQNAPFSKAGLFLVPMIIED